MKLETLQQTAQKLIYSAPKLSQLGTMQAFVQNGGGNPVEDAGLDEFSS
jgi:hypothetical protein